MNPVKVEELDRVLIEAQEKFILQLVLDHFSLARIVSGLEPLVSNPEVVKANIPEFKSLLVQLGKSASELLTLSERFQTQVKQLHKQNGFKDQQVLQARIESALAYFVKELSIQLINQLNKNIRIKPKNKLQQQLQHMLQQYRQVVENRIALMHKGTGLLKEPIPVSDYVPWIEKHKPTIKAKPGSASGQPQSVTMQLF
jgi:transcription initiation factor TFIID subunit TAF12